MQRRLGSHTSPTGQRLCGQRGGGNLSRLDLFRFSGSVINLNSAMKQIADWALNIATQRGAAYVDFGQSGTPLMEYIEMGDGLRAVFDLVRDAAEAWDGNDPVRQLG